MDTNKYESECLKTLSDPVFYEELPSDLNPSYRQAIDETINNLPFDQIIDEFEGEQMKDRVRTLFLWTTKNPQRVRLCSSTPVNL